MPQEQVRLEAPDVPTTEGTADIIRSSKRAKVFWATVVLVLGVGGGIASILIPILHFFSTWILPLTAYLVARRILNRPFSVRSLCGTCPACSKPITLGGRVIPNSQWQHCPACQVRMRIVVDEIAASLR